MTDKQILEPMDAFNCTCANLRMATRAVTQLYSSVLGPSGLRGSQFTLISWLARKGPLSMNELAGFLVTDRTTLTRNLGPLEREGLVEIAPGEDRRVRMVSITEAGRAVYERAKPLWAEAQTAMVERLGDKDWRKLIEALRATVAAVR
ncbi:MAG: MarR family winged helix-turn-helix transcriptional regulator [Alphaproteobacteria bacterium]